MSELTKEQCEEIRGREKLATRGPWNCACNATFDQRWYGIGAPQADDGADDLGRVVCMTRARETGVNGLENAQFISRARQDIPALLDTVAALRAKLDEAKAALRMIADRRGNFGSGIKLKGIAHEALSKLEAKQ